MASVDGLQQDVQTVWENIIPGMNLSDNHMSKIIKWAVLDFKKKYASVF